MKKTLAQHAGMDKNDIRNGKKNRFDLSKVHHFFLEDKFENNPSEYCPNCDSHRVKCIHSHNVDGYDYQCEECGMSYGLYYYHSWED